MKKMMLLFVTIAFLLCKAKTQDPEWIVLNSANSGLQADRIQCVLIDQTNTKWIGTYMGGLTKFDGTG